MHHDIEAEVESGTPPADVLEQAVGATVAAIRRQPGLAVHVSAATVAPALVFNNKIKKY
ncbi:hypothetical protein [Litchfieldella rifensis]|uniref:Uncharacterized protein n=1 Tax=Litchfieldella rifensis TaxID=762643 RepID=A0ABV7LR74_9GAMM